MKEPNHLIWSRRGHLLSAQRDPFNDSEGRCKATWKREFNVPWREAGPPDHHGMKVDSDQQVTRRVQRREGTGILCLACRSTRIAYSGTLLVLCEKEVAVRKMILRNRSMHRNAKQPESIEGHH